MIGLLDFAIIIITDGCWLVQYVNCDCVADVLLIGPTYLWLQDRVDATKQTENWDLQNNKKESTAGFSLKESEEADCSRCEAMIYDNWICVNNFE